MLCVVVVGVVVVDVDDPANLRDVPTASAPSSRTCARRYSHATLWWDRCTRSSEPTLCETNLGQASRSLLLCCYVMCCCCCVLCVVCCLCCCVVVCQSLFMFRVLCVVCCCCVCVLLMLFVFV